MCEIMTMIDIALQGQLFPLKQENPCPWQTARSYCSYSRCPRMKIFTSVLKGNVPSSLRKRYSSLASLNIGLLSQTKKRPHTVSNQFWNERVSKSICNKKFYHLYIRSLNIPLLTLVPLLPSYRGEWCHDPWGAAGGRQQLLGLELPYGSQASL